MNSRYIRIISSATNMSIKLNRREEIIEQAKAEGRFSYMDSEEDDEIREAINAHAAEVKRDFEYKHQQSIIAASKVILTA